MTDTEDRLHREHLARLCRLTLERLADPTTKPDRIYRRHYVEFIDIYDEMTFEPSTIATMGLKSEPVL
jgi:hypothetical protein